MPLIILPRYIHLTHGRSPASGGSRWGNASRTPIVRQALPKDDGSMVSPKRGHFFLAHWSKSDVYAYIRHHRLKGFPHTWGSSQPHSHPAQHYESSPTNVGGTGLVNSCKSGWLFPPNTYGLVLEAALTSLWQMMDRNGHFTMRTHPRHVSPKHDNTAIFPYL